MIARRRSNYSPVALVLLLAAGLALLTQAVSAAGSAGAGAPAKGAKAAAVAKATPAAPGASAKITYQDQIEPIFRNNCSDCHNPDAKKAGLDLTSASAILAGSSNGKVAKPGDPDGSKLYRVLAHEERPFMPQDADKLSEKDLTVIKAWITQGMLENANSKVAQQQPASPLAIAAPAVGRPAGAPPMPTVALSMTLPVHTGRPSPLASLAASPWAPLVAIGGQKSVLLYNTNTLALLGVLPFPEGLPDSLRFSRNGSLLIAAGGEGARIGKVDIYSVATGKRIAEVGDEYDQVLSADISPDQSQIAMGTTSKLLKVFATNQPLKPLYVIKKHTDWVTAVAFSPDGKLLASGDRAGNLFLFAADSGGEMFTLSGHRDAIQAVVFRDDGNALASASQDGTVKLWDPHSGDLLKTISANSGGVMDVAFSHDGQIVTAGRDKWVRTFTSDGGSERSFGPFPDMALHAVFTDDGQRIIAGDWTGAIDVFKAKDSARFGELWADPLTPAELAAHHAEAQARVTEQEAHLEQAAAGLAVAQGEATKADAEMHAARSARSAASLAARHAADALLEMNNSQPNPGTVALPEAHRTGAATPAAIAAANEKLKTLRVELSAAGKRVLVAEQSDRQAQDALALAKAVVDSTTNDLTVAKDFLERYQPAAPPPVPSPAAAKTAAAKTAAAITGKTASKAP